MKNAFVFLYAFFCAMVLAIVPQCGSDDPVNGNPPPEPTRPYYLGFTPWPYDLTQEAIDYAYAHIASDADIIAHHLDDGIPWPEALNGAVFHQDMLNDWNYRKSHTPAGHKTYLALTPINNSRNALALYRANGANLPLPAPWNGRAFNHPDVKTAYLNYCKKAIEFFRPDYLAVGIESNLLLTNVPALWDGYLELHEYVYTELKNLYPSLPIMATVFGMALLDGYRGEDNHQAQTAGFARLMAHSDYFAVSLYPFMTKILTDSIPAGMLDSLFSLSAKPITVSETGYPAQTFSLSSPPVTFNTNPEKQDAFIKSLLEQANKRRFVFVVQFTLRDYDQLWEKLGRSEIALIWRDTGLYDENGVARPALTTWKNALAVPYSR